MRKFSLILSLLSVCIAVAAQQLLEEFMRDKNCEVQLAGEDPPSEAFIQGALETAIGIINRQDKSLGCYEFAAWYQKLLKKEGQIQ